MKIFFGTIMLALISIATFDSCASNKSAASPATQENTTTLNPVYVTNRKKVYPLPPSAIKDEIECYQIFSGKFSFKGETKEFSAPVYLSASSEGIVIMLLTDFGIEAGTITYDGNTAEIESTFFPKNLKCEYIILDLQNAYCDIAALEAHYGAAGLLFSQEDDGTKRVLSDGKKIIEEISISPSEIRIKNLLRKYEYRLDLRNY